MSKYFDTKPGSLEEAVSAAQQAAIAISKKEKGEKPKNEDQGQFSFVAAQAKKNGEKTFTFAGKEYEVEKVECPKCEGKGCDHCEGKGYHEEGFKTETNKNDKSDDGDGLDAVQPDAVKKKFKDRKDKDIDNDGDVDDSDKFLHKRRKAVSKAMGEEITEEEFEMMIEALTELSPALLKRARDAAKAKSQRADDRSMKMRKLGKGDSDLTKKLDKETDKKAAQARKFDRAADDAKYDRLDKAADKLDKGPKSKNPDVDDYGKTKADKVRDGNVKSKDAEKVRRRDAAAGQKQGKGSLGATDKRVANQGDAYAKYQAKGGKLSRNDYLKRFGKSIKRDHFETDAEWEAHLMELHRTITPLKDTIVNMWKEAQDMEQDKDGDGMDDDQKAKKTAKKTDSGKDMTPVDTSPKMPKTKIEKNKV